MKLLSPIETKSVSAGVSLFYPALFLGQAAVWTGTLYSTLWHVKESFMSYPGSQAVVSVLSQPLFGVPVGAMTLTAIGGAIGYWGYYLIASI